MRYQLLAHFTRLLPLTMDYDTDSDITATISHSNNFTPINSPKGKRIAQTNNVVMKTEESDQYPSPIKTEETMGVSHP